MQRPEITRLGIRAANIAMAAGSAAVGVWLVRQVGPSGWRGTLGYVIVGCLVLALAAYAISTWARVRLRRR